jgi:hypothetical protein
MGSGHWRFLALPHGINYMGSEMHSPVYIFVLLLLLISPLGLEVYGFSIPYFVNPRPRSQRRTLLAEEE